MKNRTIKTYTKVCKTCKREYNAINTLQSYCSYPCALKNKKKCKGKKCCINKKPCRRNTNATFEKNKRELKQKMIDDIGYVHCQHCKRSNGARYEAHHIIYRSEKPGHEHLHDKRNLIIVCKNCHNDFHNNKGKRNGLVEERGLQKIFGNDVLDK